MAVFHLNNVKGTEFPAGRLTRVLAGPGAPAEPDHFVMGYVTIYPRGEVPRHAHDQEEIYLILGGSGLMEVDGEETPVQAGNFASMLPGQSHSLRNTGTENLVMIFCYAPKGVVEHWAQELASPEVSQTQVEP